MIRDYQPSDFEQLRQIHERQEIDFKLPEINRLDDRGNDTGEKNPLFFIAKVLEKRGTIRAALVLKICAETILILDKDQEPQEKLAEMQELQSTVLDEAYRNGLDEIYAAVGPIGFDKRLIQLGWEVDRPGWRLWSRQTDEKRG